MKKGDIIGTFINGLYAEMRFIEVKGKEFLVEDSFNIRGWIKGKDIVPLSKYKPSDNEST